MSYKNKDDNDTGESVSAWGRCCAQTCDIPPGATQGGNQYCTYHLGCEQEHFDAVTAAIKNNMEHYNYMLTLMRWDNNRWKIGWQTVTKYQFCPLVEGEQVLPHRYIERLNKHLRSVIKSESRI